MCQPNYFWNPAMASPAMFPMSMPVLPPMGPQCCPSPQMQGAGGQLASQPMGAMGFGAPISQEARQEQAKSFLNAQKEQLLQTKKFLEEQQKMLDQSIAAIESQLANLNKTETQTGKPAK